MIDTVLLDLDDTILDFHKSEAFALKKTLEELGIEPLSSIIERYSEINDAQWKLLELGKITREQVLTGRFEILFKELGVNRSGDKAWQLYENNLSNSYFIIDGTIDVLEKLRTNIDCLLYLTAQHQFRIKELPVLISQNILKIFLFLRKLDITSLK